MSYDTTLIDFAGLKEQGWLVSFDATLRMSNKGRFPRPYRRGTSEFDTLWRAREALPLIRRPHLAKR